MFRKLRKKEISLDAINNLLNNSKRAVLALNGDDGYPYAYLLITIMMKIIKRFIFMAQVKGIKEIP